MFFFCTVTLLIQSEDLNDFYILLHKFHCNLGFIFLTNCLPKCTSQHKLGSDSDTVRTYSMVRAIRELEILIVSQFSNQTSQMDLMASTWLYNRVSVQSGGKAVQLLLSLM